MTAPLLIDLFCGSFGWSAGWLELGGRVIGFDIEHEAHHGPVPCGAHLVLQDVRTIDGARFKDASLIVASSPCQEFSYRAMPWKRAKALGPPLLGMELFAQAFRIQREAIAAAGRFIPMVQENVRGANPWVRAMFGRSRYSFGSFHLWGDVPALMPITRSVRKSPTGSWDPSRANFVEGTKTWGPRGDDWFTHHNRPEFEDRATKNDGSSWFNVAHNTTSGKGQNPVHREISKAWRDKHYDDTDKMALQDDGVKQGGDWFNAAALDGDGQQSISRRSNSKSSARKAASARIAKIPIVLARHIAQVYFPRP